MACTEKVRLVLGNYSKKIKVTLKHDDIGGASNLSSFKFYKTTFQYVLLIDGYFLENNRCHQLF